MKKNVFVLLCTLLSISVASSTPLTPEELPFDDSVNVVEIDEIVVSGTRNEISRRKSSSIVGVVGRGLFDAMSANSAADVLSFQPGLRLEYTCANCGVPQLRINGLEGQYTQVLLDSRPIFSSLAMVYGLEQLPESMIERVEVIRGGGSALYGSSAIAGVVNIITREPKVSTFSVSNNTGFYQGGGSDINTSINGSIVSKDNKAGASIFAMIRDRSAYDRNGDSFTDIPELKSSTIGLRGFYRLTDLSRLTAEYHHIEEYRRGGDSLDLQPHRANIAEQLEHRIDGGALEYDYIFPSMNHRLNASISGQNIARKSYFGTNQNLDAYGSTFDATINGGLQYTWNIDKFLFLPSEFTAGVEYNNNYLHDVMSGYNRNLTQLTEYYGVYVQNEWRNDRISLLIGGRLDKHNMIQDVIFSPRANVRYMPTQDITLRASYSSGYRAPQAYNEDLHIEAVNGNVSLIYLDPDLKPEYSHSATLSFDYIKSWNDLTLNITTEGFYTSLNDVFVLVQTGTDPAGNILYERTNASGAKIAGVNLEARMNYRDVVLFNGGITYQSAYYDDPFEWSPDVEAQRKMFRAPNLYGYLAATYNPIKSLAINANATYTGSMLVQHAAGYVPTDVDVTTQSFWDLGLKVAYTFELPKNMKLEINTGVKNILNAFQEDLDFGADKDAGYIYGPSMPRTYFVGAKFVI